MRLSEPTLPAGDPVYYDVNRTAAAVDGGNPGVDFRTEWFGHHRGRADGRRELNVTVYGDSDYETDELIRVEVMTGADGAVVALSQRLPADHGAQRRRARGRWSASRAGRCPGRGQRDDDGSTVTVQLSAASGDPP